MTQNLIFMKNFLSGRNLLVNMLKLQGFFFEDFFFFNSRFFRDFVQKFTFYGNHALKTSTG